MLLFGFAPLLPLFQRHCGEVGPGLLAPALIVPVSLSDLIGCLSGALACIRKVCVDKSGLPGPLCHGAVHADMTVPDR